MDEYLRRAFEEVFSDDGLIVMGRGLGLGKLFAKFTQYYSTPSNPTGSSNSNSSSASTVRKLVLCLNCTGHEEAIRGLLLSEGVLANRLPPVINNEVPAQERLERYSDGGCYFVTARILIVDLLDQKLDAAKITGLLVFNAHKITETSIEAFILRVFRERNRNGFIKAFSDEPEALQSGFGKLERLLRVLYVQKLFLWPRFRLEVTQALQQRVPEVVELSLSLTAQMKGIQSAVLVAMKTTIQELKKGLPHLETSQMTLENGLFQAFDYQLKSQLDPEWHKVPHRCKQLIADLGVLRKLLDYLVRYDAFSFYYLLMKLHAASSEQTSPSLWMTSEAADQIFRRAKERVYRIAPDTELAANAAVAAAQAAGASSGAVEIFSDARKRYGLKETLERVLECPPKWKLLEQVLLEIREHHVKYRHSQKLQTTHTKNAIDAAEPADTALKFTDCSNRVLLIARDGLALKQLRDVAVAGSDHVTDQRFRWFTSQKAAEIRRRCNQRVAAQLATATRGGGQRGARQSQSKGASAARNSADTTTASAAVLSSMDILQSAQQMLLDAEEQSQDVTVAAAATTALHGVDVDGVLEVPLSAVASLPGEQKQLLLQEFLMRHSAASGDEVDMTAAAATTTAGSSSGSGDRSELYSSRLDASTVAGKRSRECFEEQGEEDHEEEEQCCSATAAAAVTCHLLDPQLHVVMMTQAEFSSRLGALQDLCPQYVVLYDPHVATIRALEAYQSQRCGDIDGPPLKIYFMIYEGSTEEHRYVGALAKEKRAFESLIKLKEHLVISLPDHPADLASDAEIITDTRQIGCNNNSNNNSSSSCGSSGGRRIVVDVREFRSSLPSMLHCSQSQQQQQRFQLVPRTISVGDYVLTPQLCVERKGISDLFQSFASGRLYNQAEAMGKYYNYPCLLIEFAADKPFALITAGDIPSDVHQYSITSRISLLVLSFPNLRLLWSRSATSTVEIFKSLVASREEVDVEKAVSVGSAAAADNDDDDGESTKVAVATTSNSNNSNNGSEQEEARAAARAILLSLPGVNANNCRNVIQNVSSLAELSAMSASQLSLLVGPVNANKLYNFFRQRRSSSV